MTQGFDAANRLTSRTIARGAGVEGPTAEIFAYDGLSRLTQAQSGIHVTSQTYDSLSRRLTETTDGRTITYEHDDAGNATQQIYPSGTSSHALVRRARSHAGVSSGKGTHVTYGFRGTDLVAAKSLGNGLAGGDDLRPCPKADALDPRRRELPALFRASLLESEEPEDRDPARGSEQPGLSRRL